MKVDKKLLQQHLSEKTGKIVTLKDLSNVQTSIRESSDRNDLGALTTLLRSIEGKAFNWYSKQYPGWKGSRNHASFARETH